MSAITFDTLKFSKRLQEAGLPAKEAEAISEAFRDVQGELELVTKSDLRQETERIEHKLQQMELRLTVKLGTMLVVAVSVIAALIKIL